MYSGIGCRYICGDYNAMDGDQMMYILEKSNGEIITMATTKAEAIEQASTTLMMSIIGIKRAIILGEMILYRDIGEYQLPI